MTRVSKGLHLCKHYDSILLYMNNAVITVRTEPDIREKAKETADKLGVSLNSVINNYLRQFIEEKTITYTVDELTPYAKEEIAKAEQVMERGEVMPIFTDNAEKLAEDPEKYRPLSEQDAWLEKQGI